jgi:hypothetical protein
MRTPSSLFRLLVTALCLLAASLTWGQPLAPSTRTLAKQADHRKLLLELSANPGARATELSAETSVPGPRR